MSKQTAAEWLETAEATMARTGKGAGGWLLGDAVLIAHQALAMLRDTRAELERVMDELRTTSGLLMHEEPQGGWDAIEAKWREGGYR